MRNSKNISLICYSFLFLILKSGSIFAITPGSHIHANPPNSVFLHSPTVTDFGVWGDLEECKNGHVVVGMQLKVEVKKPTTVDETGLNGIKFFCSQPRDHRETNSPIKSYKIITSSIGDFGEWRAIFECEGVATGFQLRSQSYQGPSHDDTAANNLRLFCSDLHGDGGYLEGDGTEWGNWTEPKKCSKGYAICGLQTQVEENKMLIDDTALNNLAVKCCATNLN